MSQFLGKLVRIAVLSLILAIALTGVVSAQTGAPGEGARATTRTQETRSDRGSDWSWLGLLGLAGLAGLAGFFRRNGDTHHRDLGTSRGTSART